MKQLSSVIPIVLLVGFAAPVWAQRRPPKDSTKKVEIPADARPPKGMCRVWIKGVPAAQQPAATDCPSAVKNLPANARILFGDEPADSGKRKSARKPKLPSNIKGFADVKPVAPPTVPKRPPEP